MQEGGFRVAPVEGARQRHDPGDAGLLKVERPVQKVKKRLAAEKRDAGRVGPDDARARRVPKPGRFGHVPQVIQRGGRHLSQQDHPSIRAIFTMA